MHISKKDRHAKTEEMKARFTNIYVKNLDESVTDEKFLELFNPFGTITSAVISRDENGKSRGFAFVNYENHDAAAAAVDALNEKEIEGKTIYVGRAQKKNEREEELRKQYEKIREEKLSKYQGVNLYIKNLDEGVEDDVLRKEFATYGTITSAKVMRDEKGISKGFGFVCFSSPDEATKAVTEMNGKMLNGKPIYVALAQRKEVRRAQLAAQMQQRSAIRLQQGGMAGGMAGGMGVPVYPGNPLFYAPPNGVPQRGPGGGVFFQQPMVPRPRHWVTPSGNAGVPSLNMPQGYPNPNGLPPTAFGGNVPMPGNQSATGGVRPPRQPRGGPGSVNSGPNSGPMSTQGSGRSQQQQQQNQPGQPSMSSVSQQNQGQIGPMQSGQPQPIPGNIRPGVPVLPNQSMATGPVPPTAASVAAAGRGRGGYKYTPNARNAPQVNGSVSGPNVSGMTPSSTVSMSHVNNVNPSSSMAPNVGGIGGGVGPKLNAATLASLPADQQKRMLGENLFPLIVQQAGSMAGKVTGMLLEMDNGELLHLLESPEALGGKVREAVNVLEEHLKNSAAAVDKKE